MSKRGFDREISRSHPLTNPFVCRGAPRSQVLERGAFLYPKIALVNLVIASKAKQSLQIEKDCRGCGLAMMDA